MKTKTLRRLVALAGLLLAGIIIIQVLWIRNAQGLVEQQQKLIDEQKALNEKLIKLLEQNTRLLKLEKK